LEDLSLKEYQRFYDGFTEEIKEKIKLEKAVNSRNHKGGTATAAVLERIREFEKNSGKK
jgi:argininosuccinate lyase